MGESAQETLDNSTLGGGKAAEVSGRLTTAACKGEPSDVSCGEAWNAAVRQTVMIVANLLQRRACMHVPNARVMSPRSVSQPASHFNTLIHIDTPATRNLVISLRTVKLLGEV